MTEIKKLLPNMDRVLIPVDQSDASDRAVRFAACLLAPLTNGVVQEIVLLHVLGVSFLEKMAANIDLRIAALKETPLFKKLAREYVEKEIQPFMEEVEGLLREAGVKCKITRQVIEGDPTKEIINFALKGKIHTIVMGRRRRSALAERVLGSCSYAVSHRPGRHTDYIVGLEEIDIHACPVPRILVPVDGSRFATNALKEAAALALAFPDEVIEISTLYVVEAAYEQTDGEGQKILKEAKELLLSLGISEKKLQTILVFGDPAEEIVRVAEEGSYNIIMMGRTGKSGLREIILGSVSSRVLHLATRPTVALISPAD